MKANPLTAKRLHALAELYQQGQVSELMDHTLEKLLRHEAEQCQAQLRQLQADLAEFERNYQRSSTEFYQRFQAGQTRDANQGCYGLCGMGLTGPDGRQSPKAAAPPNR